MTVSLTFGQLWGQWCVCPRGLENVQQQLWCQRRVHRLIIWNKQKTGNHGGEITGKNDQYIYYWHLLIELMALCWQQTGNRESSCRTKARVHYRLMNVYNWTESGRGRLHMEAEKSLVIRVPSVCVCVCLTSCCEETLFRWRHTETFQIWNDVETHWVTHRPFSCLRLGSDRFESVVSPCPPSRWLSPLGCRVVARGVSVHEEAHWWPKQTWNKTWKRREQTEGWVQTQQTSQEAGSIPILYLKAL